MIISIDDARALAISVFVKAGMEPDYAAIIADHVLYAEASGEASGGLARVLALVEEFRERPKASPIAITDKSPSSAIVDGGGHTGYVTSLYAIDKAITLAKATGFGLVGMRNAWFSGQLSYYVARAAEQGFIAIHCAGAKARVAPTDGIDPILGTNPLAFGFPADPDPLVIDIGTSSITVAQMMMAQKLGKPLDEGAGIDRDGNPTTDPAELWRGALHTWGGHRGYGISLAVHLLGILGGGAPVVSDVSDSGFFFLVINPELLLPLEEFKQKAGELVSRLENSRPQVGKDAVRVHGKFSAARRKAALLRGSFEIADEVHALLLEMQQGTFRAPALLNNKPAGT